jgi:hypothetical protein
MITNAKRAILALAGTLMLLLVVCAATPAQAAVENSDSIWLTTNGATSLPGGSDWKIYVETPKAVGLDADHWNLTVFAVPLNASATNATYTVTVYIYDGATNISKSSALACKNDLTVYGNISFAAADYASVVENRSAVIYVKNVNGSAVVKDSWTGEIQIYQDELTGTLMNLILVIIPLMIMVLVIGWFSNVFSGLQKAFKR